MCFRFKDFFLFLLLARLCFSLCVCKCTYFQRKRQLCCAHVLRLCHSYLNVTVSSGVYWLNTDIWTYTLTRVQLQAISFQRKFIRLLCSVLFFRYICFFSRSQSFFFFFCLIFYCNPSAISRLYIRCVCVCWNCRISSQVPGRCELIKFLIIKLIETNLAIYTKVVSFRIV